MLIEIVLERNGWGASYRREIAAIRVHTTAIRRISKYYVNSKLIVR